MFKQTEIIQYILAVATSLKQIPDYEMLIWKGLDEGTLNETEAEELAEAAANCRRSLTQAREEKMPPSRSYFPKRPPTGRSRVTAATGKRDPERWKRKRRLADMAALLPRLRGEFTEGQRAVLYIVVSDYVQYGSCTRSAKEIADRAGVRLTTTRNAIRKARQLEVIHCKQRPQWRGKHLPNVITVVCLECLAWLKRFKPKLGFNFKGIKIATATEIYDQKRTYGQPFYSPTGSPPGR